LYILGVAGGQLVYGPLSDALGRRPMLLAGLGLYVAAGVAAAFAPDVHTLIVARLFQALGGCAGLALGRAIVRDTAPIDEAVRQLALINLMMMAGPGLAPLLGSGFSAAFGWRSIFIALAALGALTLAFTWRMLPETGHPSGSVKVGVLVRDYTSLLGSRTFLGYAVGGGCSTTSIYGFVSAAPFIVSVELHRPIHEVGFYLALVMVGIALGNILTRQLIRRVAIARLMITGNAIAVASALALLAVVLSGHLSIAWTVGLMFPYALGAGLASPAALTKAISVDSARVGSASGLYGCAQMVVGAICTSLVGLGQGSALVAAGVLSGAALLGQMGFWVGLRGERAAHRRARENKP
jgi:DHA1 family bicyclomycin/chloramphenicol resistance-like MFS transporter